ncbi:hypothetical protein A1O3_01054 [Capronia epimyces CBS 606.96]|uniref:SnoaL-like domain-containing protein n=1 Tax=Capronia epimyces CBS 606.96 TaxID=1182542 RepID=W9YHZ0_9EURO|nr:uncharacterized protein A1O3_01054 [Capronia epimyces CBS 606.96]EXJ92502.1 hypothetical protein A1O3_01054 [Capronia epimyces CBS 606.96]
MPSHSARSILEAFYAAEAIYMSAPPEERDFSGMAARVACDIRLEQTSALPYAGVYIGPQGMQEWSRKMAGYFDVVEVRDREIFESTNSASAKVVVLSNLHLRVRKTGQELVFPHCQENTVDLERGVLTEMRIFYWDVKAINDALGYKT